MSLEQDTFASLEQKTIKAYDQGLRGLQIRPDAASSDSDLLSVEDFQALVEKGDADDGVRSVPAQIVYRSLKTSGVEACAEILPFLSEDQFTRLIDYDAWQGDEFILERAMAWVALYGKVDPSGEQFFNRFKNLDEEYQLSMLVGQVQVTDLETYEDMPSHEQDEYIALPGQEIYYKILNREESVRDFIKALVEIGLGQDLRYTVAVLMHASYMPPNESQHELERIRRSHLEEDGFVSFQESQSTFASIDYQALRRKYKDQATQAHGLVALDDSNKSYLEKTTELLVEESPEKAEDVQSGILFLANNLCAAAQLEPDQVVELQELLKQVRALLSLGLEYLSRSNIYAASEILKNEHPKILFRAALSLIHELGGRVVKDLEDYYLSDLTNAFTAHQWGRVQFILDRSGLDVFGQESVSLLKGLMNRFPLALVPITRQTLEYQHIDSRAVLRDLAQNVAAFAALATFARSRRATDDIVVDKVLATLFVQSALKQKTLAATLTSEQLHAFVKMPTEDLASRFQEAVQRIITDMNVSMWCEKYSIDTVLTESAVSRVLLANLQQISLQLQLFHQSGRLEDLEENVYVD